jgi:DNA-binding NarL/FixJ family response regulator/PAS domain-containing protein
VCAHQSRLVHETADAVLNGSFPSAIKRASGGKGAVADNERELADCVGAIYEAAAQGGDWLDVGERLRRLFSAPRAMLRIASGPHASPNILMTPDGSETIYAAHFHLVDPFVARARRDFDKARADHIGRAKVSAELVPEKTFLRSEFYADFARLHGRRHMIGGMVGIADASPVALFRGEGESPFSAEDVALLQTLLPHLQRALELRQRLAHDREAAWTNHAAFEALPVAVACVDAGMRIRSINAAARKFLSDKEAGLRTMRSGPYAGAGLYLAAVAREAAAALRRLVMSAVSGGSGGSMPFASGGARCAALVSPCPRALMPGAGGVTPSEFPEALAMVVLHPIGRDAPPPLDALCDLYGFSRAEAEVAAALSGGGTAEQVARQRGVSLMTVRSQVRSILGKSECENLRDLERSMAALAALTPRR